MDQDEDIEEMSDDGLEHLPLSKQILVGLGVVETMLVPIHLLKESSTALKESFLEVQKKVVEVSSTGGGGSPEERITSLEKVVKGVVGILVDHQPIQQQTATCLASLETGLETLYACLKSELHRGVAVDRLIHSLRCHKVRDDKRMDEIQALLDGVTRSQATMVKDITDRFYAVSLDIGKVANKENQTRTRVMEWDIQIPLGFKDLGQKSDVLWAQVNALKGARAPSTPVVWGPGPPPPPALGGGAVPAWAQPGWGVPSGAGPLAAGSLAAGPTAAGPSAAGPSTASPYVRPEVQDLLKTMRMTVADAADKPGMLEDLEAFVANLAVPIPPKEVSKGGTSRIPHPVKFSGMDSTVDVEDAIYIFSSFLAATGVPEDQWGTMGLHMLSGTAQSQYLLLAKSIAPAQPTWAQFTGVLQQFAQPNKRLAALKALRALKQLTTVAAYIQQFRLLVAKAGQPPLSDSELTLYFWGGLSEKARSTSPTDPQGVFWRDPEALITHVSNIELSASMSSGLKTFITPALTPHARLKAAVVTPV
jgi:hypothetical protein